MRSSHILREFLERTVYLLSSRRYYFLYICKIQSLVHADFSVVADLGEKGGGVDQTRISVRFNYT